MEYPVTCQAEQFNCSRNLKADDNKIV